MRISAAVAIGLVSLVLLGCGSCGPEFRPGLFDEPLEVSIHGRFVEKRYRASTGAGTEGSTNYIILEVGKSSVRIPDGFIKQTSYCETSFCNAVALQVRGNNAGIYILQIDGDKQIYEKLCDYSAQLGSWDEARFKQCETEWDAESRTRVASCGTPKDTYLIPESTKPQWLNIEFENPKCTATDGNECSREYVFPESGFFCTSGPKQKGWYSKEFFLVDSDGNRTPLDPSGNIWKEGTLSKDELALETGKGRCHVTLYQFFYGKRADIKPINPIFQNEDFLNNYHPECKY